MANTELFVAVTAAAQIEIDADRTIAKVTRRSSLFSSSAFSPPISIA